MLKLFEKSVQKYYNKRYERKSRIFLKLVFMHKFNYSSFIIRKLAKLIAINFYCIFKNNILQNVYNDRIARTLV